MVKKRPWVFGKPVWVETTAEELVVLVLIEDVDELVNLAVELAGLDVTVDVEVATPDRVTKKRPTICVLTYLGRIGNSMDYMTCMRIQQRSSWVLYRLSHRIVHKQIAGH